MTKIIIIVGEVTGQMHTYLGLQIFHTYQVKNFVTNRSDTDSLFERDIRLQACQFDGPQA